MKLLIAALALLSFVATSALPETVLAQAASGQTQTTTDTGMPKTAKKTTHRKHTTSKKKSGAKKHATKHPKKHRKHGKRHSKGKKPSTKKPAAGSNPS